MSRAERRDPDKLHGDQSAMAAMLENGCRGKVRHPSKRHAMSAGTRTLTLGYKTARGLVLNAYKCRSCGSWHLGHSPRRYVTPEVIVRSAPTEIERALADALRVHLDTASRTYDLD